MSTLLEVRAVSVSFDGFKAINDLSFSIDATGLHAIIGPNGAGKTTFMDVVTGKTKPDKGKILWGAYSENLLRYNESQIACKGIGRKFQKPTIFEQQSVCDNLNMALANKRGPFATLIYQKNSADIEKVEKLASEIGLLEHVDRRAGNLSHGQKQWLEIGMLLAQDPKLLLVDEPAAGMTQEERQKTVALLRRAAETRAVIVVEHDMEFVRNLDCKVTVLHEGAVLAEGSVNHVTQDKQVIEVYLGR